MILNARAASHGYGKSGLSRQRTYRGTVGHDPLWNRYGWNNASANWRSGVCATWWREEPAQMMLIVIGWEYTTRLPKSLGSSRSSGNCILNL